MDVYLTREGYEKLESELQRLKKLKVELSREIGEAMEQGDLRENAGYTAAKERQAEVLRRIAEIDEKLRKAKLIEELNVSKDEIRIGAKVTLREKESGEEFVYILTGQEEADPARGTISVHSPLAQGLLGLKAGQEAKINLPAGLRSFKILKVE
ncbi:MAG: transcription elongation factor GreA [Elusimicrobia bacterium]|nr:transcription elongation factor GreA [Elusimicrobiota bacterium]